jgi:hypothetical protein
MTRRIRTGENWSDDERAIIARGAAGELSVPEMVDALPGRSIKSIRRRYATHGSPDEDERFRRSCTVASYGLERAIKEIYL